MPRMPKKRKLELSFFLNERGRVTYNDLCRKCQRTCKQSFRAVIVDCPHYLSKRSKRKGKPLGTGKVDFLLSPWLSSQNFHKKN